MENREQLILAEIKSMVDSIRKQLEELDIKMAEYRQVIDPQGDDMVPIDLDIEELEPQQQSVVQQEIPVEIPEEQPVAIQVEDPVKADEAPEDIIEFPVTEESEVVVETPEEIDDLPSDDDDLPFFDVREEQEKLASVSVNDSVRKDAGDKKVAMIDAMVQKQAWRTDMPGTPVKDIRSAISLNDRILFINSLFGEDPMRFVNALTEINAMNTLDEVVEYLLAGFPSWNMESDVVYRFMMAVRRKIN